MAIITISIIESPLQLLAGIPSNITLETNIPATIFYTLDGSEPSIASRVAVGPIPLPTDVAYVVVRATAENGVDTSGTITQEYFTNVVPARHPHDTVVLDSETCNQSTYPFGSPSSGTLIPQRFGNTGGVIYDDGQPPRAANAYGGADGYGDYYNPPLSQYQFKFSETNEIGEMGRGIGTMPGRVISVKPRNNNEQTQSTNAASALFDPRALVIFQDSRDGQFDPDIPRINRPYFDLEDQTKARDGTLLTNTDAITPQGGFLKAHYNPTDNSLTYYYYDNRVSRWIISKEPFHPSQNPTANMSGMVTRSGREQGAGMVFKWIPFKYRRLV
jgi:hypothetical protein